MLRPSRCCLIGLLLLLLAPAPATANKFALVTAREMLTLREEPKAAGRQIESLLRFQPVQILERKTIDKHEWARVKTVKVSKAKSNTGWVLSVYLSQTAFAYVDDDKLNVRRGPGTDYEIIMHYGRNYPVQVLDVATNGWIKLRDVDGDMGWVHPKLLKPEPNYVITSGPYKIFNVREGIGVETPIKFRAERDYLLQVLGEKEGWLNVKDRDGEAGWISAKIVYGWLDPEYPKPEE